MNFIDEVKDKIGIDIYNKIEKEAENEVALAMKMPLVNEWREDKYYQQRFSLPLFLEECSLFYEKGLTISPIDVFYILFTCKIFLASSSEKEYHQRAGGAYFHDEHRFTIPWTSRSIPIDILLIAYFEQLRGLQKDRILMTSINSFKNPEIPTTNLPKLTTQDFFKELFIKLNIPFHPFFDGPYLIDEHKKYEPGLSLYNEHKAKYLFQPPSIGHAVFGSAMYCQLYSSAWLRTFFNLLRISGFIHPGQIDFGQELTGLKAPTSSVFLGTHTWGVFSWDEDKKEPWAKIPDGCLFLSFGYRGLSDMWIDRRTYGGIEKFFTDNKSILECLDNPWSQRNLYDVMPTLDILSSATQIPDTGAKVLQVYCCLEHLFVPKNIVRDNKKYIVGGINALKPELLKWFNELYQLRCTYAHRGFVIRDEKTRILITQSIQNIMILLVSKIKN
jgi:hypothetical protein